MGLPGEGRPVGRLPLRITDHTTTIEVHALADSPADLTLLSLADQDRYRSFKNKVSADAFVRRQSQLRRSLAHVTKRPAADLDIATEENGKPFLLDDEGNRASPHFNLSSSAGLMALAIDSTRPVGVDIECHSLHHGLRAEELSPALHPAELERLAANDLEDTLQCWVYKEAWIKWSGEGMRADLKSLDLWRPGLVKRFKNQGNIVHLSRITTTVDSAWVGLVKTDDTVNSDAEQ